MNKVDHIKFAVKELFVQGNLEVVGEVFATNYVAHAGDKKYQGHDFVIKWTKQIHHAIHDIRIVDLLIICQDEQYVTWQRTLTGKHKNNLRGIPATNKKVTWNEMIVSRFENDKIMEEWVVSELAGELTLAQPRK